VELAVKLSNNSSPGPDGIPYAAWRKAGRQALVILTAAVAEIQADDFDENTLPEGFNTSYLCCLLKKPSGTDQAKGDYFLPGATRPLSLVNTDNRLIASAVRIAIEDRVAQLVSDIQKGFIRGRKMLQNVLDIEIHSMKVSLSGPDGAIILFDFEAAFPSISQDYLLDMLTRRNLPREIINVVKALYHDCKCLIKVGCTTFDRVPHVKWCVTGLPTLPSPLRFGG
jgi:hypothetical protein